MFYYYSNRSIPVGRFRDRAQWQGDTSRWDGSIQLRDVQVKDSGTYVCEIRLLKHSSIFKNRTVLHVSPVGQRGKCPVTAPLSCRPVQPHTEGLKSLWRLLGFPPRSSCSRSLWVPSPALVSPQQDEEQQVPRTLRPRDTLCCGP